MKTIKGPAIYLAQFIKDQAPYNSLQGLANWAKDKGFKGVSIPTNDKRIIDVEKAANSQTYADEIKGLVLENGLNITDLASHLQGQLVALHPAFDRPADSFAPVQFHNNRDARQKWAVNQLLCCAKASKRLGLDRHVSFTGSLLWPYFYPYPQWPDDLIKDGFDELANRWRPILNAFDDEGIDLCFEVHPTEDVHDGLSFEMFLERLDHHPRCRIMYDPSHMLLQSMDYLAFIDHYHERIGCFHVKDAEFRPNGKSGAYGGYQPWINRAGRFRSPGDGQIDFGAIFSKLTAYDYNGWATLEWECCLKNSEDGACEGANFIKKHIIRVSDTAFDDFVKSDLDRRANREILGI